MVERDSTDRVVDDGPGPRNGVATIACRPIERGSSLPGTLPALKRVISQVSLRDQVYAQLRRAILELDIYGSRANLRLDEKSLANALGVSRTPIREALTMLEHDGFVRTVPRRGIYVVRKSKSEVIEMIQMWAALESMAARLATLRATDSELAVLRGILREFKGEITLEHISKYSEINVVFHSEIVRLGKSKILVKSVQDILLHVRAIRDATIPQGNRASQSVIDHGAIVLALESRNTELAERLVREHSLGLAAFVDANCDYLG